MQFTAFTASLQWFKQQLTALKNVFTQALHPRKEFLLVV
jgi:hypothetical protein